MAFWETMTIAEMNLLLEMKEQPGVREGWEKLAEMIGRDDPGSIDQENQVLSPCVLTPAAYVFLCVRQSVSRAEDIPLPQRAEVDLTQAKLLPQLDRARGLARNYTALLYAFVAPSRNHEMTLYPPDTFLGGLLEKTREDNEDQWREGAGTQRRMEDALQNLKGVLNQWDGVLRNMWKAHYAAMCESLCAEDPTFHEIHDLVEDGVKQIILTGAPGAGKTRAAGLAARRMGAPLPEYGADPERPYPLVQFHPSYDYTDFVEGLRPVQLEGQEDAAARFVKLDGSFKAFCRSVARENKARTGSPKDDPDRRYFFLIDEINRADLSKVFGELMFCLEADKRGMPAQTQYRNLPPYEMNGETGKFRPMADDCFAGGFFIPGNVIILGTMNDIDRSVESMDFALRRRFEFFEVRVDESSLNAAFLSGGFGRILRENAREAAGLVTALNGVIAGSGSREGGQFGLNHQYDVSQGQFAHLPEERFADLGELMQYVWDRRISSLLWEYVRGEDEAEPFLAQCAEALGVRRDGRETGR